MLVQLFVKECRQTFKSIIYLIFVVCLSLFFFTQLGNTNIEGKPQKGQESYGTKNSNNPQIIMATTLSKLAIEYSQNNFVTYPIGFLKNVKVNENEKQTIQDILESSTGITSEELFKKTQAYYENNQMIYQPMHVEPRSGLDYKKFQSDMKKIDKILGGKSCYSKETIENSASEPMTYDDAIKRYDELIDEDHLTGGYARLFCDYIGIILGVAPIFLAVTRCLRDKRAQMSALIQVRQSPSFQIVISRYMSMLVMIMIPVLILSCFTLAECIFFASGEGLSIDYFAFVKYSAFWLLPEVMIVTAVGMLLTELTETAIAVLIQIIWWFISVFSGTAAMSGGNYGWNLIMRHNTESNYSGFIDDINQLIANRTVYVIAAIALIGFTVLVYEKKRKGCLDIYGKVFGNRKSKSKA